MENKNNLLKLITDFVIMISSIGFLICNILGQKEPDNYIVLVFILLCFNSLNLKNKK